MKIFPKPTQQLRKLLRRKSVALLVFLCGAINAATAASLLENGSFGTDGWTITTEGSGNWFLTSGNATPLTNDPTARPASGAFFAVTDATGPGAHSLTQAFSVPADAGFVELSFSMFVDSYGGRTVTPTLALNPGLPNQHARVDLLTANASAFDTSTASVITNLYLGTDAGNASNSFSNYRFNLTSLVTPGGHYQIRFADVANQGLMHQGVDAVRIIAEIPEPDNYALFAAGLALLMGLRLTSKRQL